MIVIKNIRIITIVISLILTTMVVHGSEVVTYTYEDLVNSYIDNSIDIKLLNIDNSIIELDYELKSDDLSSLESTLNTKKITFENKKNSSDDSSSIDDSRDAYYEAAKAYYDTTKEVKKLEFELENIDDIYNNNVKKLVYNYEKQLLDYYKLQSQINLLEATKKMYADTLSVQKTKFNLKLVTHLDVLKAENDYNQIVVQIENLKNSLKMLENNIKIQAGIPVSEQINIEIDRPEVIKPIELELMQFVNSYKKNSIDEKRQDSAFQAEMDYYEEMSDIYAIKSDELTNLNNQFELVKLDNYNYNKNTEITLVNEYYTYKQALEQLNVSKQSFEVSKRQYEEAILAKNNGFMSELQLYGMKVQYENARVQYETSIINYNLALKKVNLLFNGILQ